jgi:hypothetical protein
VPVAETTSNRHIKEEEEEENQTQKSLLGDERRAQWRRFHLFGRRRRSARRGATCITGSQNRKQTPKNKTKRKKQTHNLVALSFFIFPPLKK